ncbi:hypothetical protein [Tautonia marina]|uniref:hypothetical protein n=1 Tax=Tautonia marina TaxID=2653855 RepID=UPI001260993D|nr:hypothetical protein [Tautonia marina]
MSNTTLSAARLNANRRNALNSTGPVTEAGKARVRLNAWKHGFRAESDAIAPDEAHAVATRRAEWASAFPTNPDDGYQSWLVEQLTLASVRIDRCQEHQNHQARYEADRAASVWDLDRAADAAQLGARLSRDPDRVVSSLCRSSAGLDWLLSRWQSLADCLETAGTWDDAQRRLCLDLMQIPDEFRSSDFTMLSHLPLDELRDLVREQIDGLESLRDSASRLDLANRSLAEIGLPTSEGSELSRLRRYETSLWRRFRSLEASYKASHPPAPALDDAETDADEIDDLLTFARMTSAEPDPEPEPSRPPGPRPERAPSQAVTTAEARRAPSPIVAAEPPILMNRKARRAEKARRKARLA